MAREDLHFRLRISESLKKRIQAASDINGRSMTAEMIARLEASFPPDDAGELSDAELDAMLADIESLKRKVIQSRKRK